jgi:hypothetical protein
MALETLKGVDKIGEFEIGRPSYESHRKQWNGTTVQL